MAGGDLAGFPNGRRPGDDVVDIALRVVMGRAVLPDSRQRHSRRISGSASQAMRRSGNVPFTDGAPVSAADFDTTLPVPAHADPGLVQLSGAR